MVALSAACKEGLDLRSYLRDAFPELRLSLVIEGDSTAAVLRVLISSTSANIRKVRHLRVADLFASQVAT